MRQSYKPVFLALVTLLSISFIADAQSKKGKRPLKPAAKQVTVTLVRWPYT